MIRKTISCLAALGAAVAGFAVLGTPSIASAVAAQGAATLSVSSGTGSTNFNISLPAGAACSGSGSSNYRWDSYFVAAATDASTLTFNAGTIGNVPGGSYASQLTDISGNVLGTKNPSASPVGLISGITQVNLSSLAGAPVGAYKLGIFCANLSSSGALDAGHFWETKLTITNASTLAWVLGTAPAAPVLGGTLTANDGSLAGSFTQATADPAVTGYTVTFHPASGSDLTASLGAGVTTFTKTGLANGTQYAVTIVATNTVGNSVASNSVNGTPNPLPYNAVTSLVATPATGAIHRRFHQRRRHGDDDAQQPHRWSELRHHGHPVVHLAVLGDRCLDERRPAGSPGADPGHHRHPPRGRLGADAGLRRLHRPHEARCR